MKAISHFIRQFRCQLHQPAASAAAHASPPAPQPQAGSPGGSALPPGTRGWPGARAAPRGPPCPWAGGREHCSMGWLCSAPAQPGSVGNSSSVPKATRAGCALQPRAATLLLLAPSFLFSLSRGERMGLRLEPGLGASVAAAFPHTSLPPAQAMGTRAPGHSAILLPSRDLSWDVFCGPAASPGSGSHAEQSRSCPVPGWHPHLGDTAVRCHTPRVDNIQMPAAPGYESARTGAQQPLRDKGSCPGGCSGSRAVPVPNSERAGGRVTGSSACLAPLSPPDLPRARQTPGLAFISLLARLCFPGAKPWHGGSGPGPCLTLTCPPCLSPRARRHRHVPPGQPEHSCRESLSLTGYLKAHLCPLSPFMFRLEEPRALP